MPKPTPAKASSPSCRRDNSLDDDSEYNRVGTSRNVIGDLQAGNVKAKVSFKKRERVVAIDSDNSFMMWREFGSYLAILRAPLSGL